MKWILLAPLLATCAARQGAEEHAKSRTIKVGDLERTYWLHVPAGVTKEKAVALLFCFHGGQGSGEAMTSGSGFSALSDKEGFIAVYPEGVGRSWNDGRGEPGIEAQKKNIDDVAFVMAMIESISKEFSVDPKRIFATGISNGGFLCNRLAAERSETFAAIAPVAAGMGIPIGEKFEPKEPVSVVLMNGTEDPLVPYKGGKMGLNNRGEILGVDEIVKKWVARDGCNKTAAEMLPDTDPKDGCRIERTIWTGGKNGTEVVVYKIEGGGHTWPGGTQYLPERIIGRVCRDIVAPKVIWEFFVKHPKP